MRGRMRVMRRGRLQQRRRLLRQLHQRVRRRPGCHIRPLGRYRHVCGGGGTVLRLRPDRNRDSAQEVINLDGA